MIINAPPEFFVKAVWVLLTVLLTWIIPQGTFSGTETQIGEITRIGIFDFFTYGLLGMYYFTVLVTFIFVLGEIGRASCRERV